jgi:CubicO group peptidase (beta-lactamase class C family)
MTSIFSFLENRKRQVNLAIKQAVVCSSIFCSTACGLWAQNMPATDHAGREDQPFAHAFQSYLDRHEIPGAVFLVATRENILDEEAIGEADISNHRPMQVDQIFWIASMTKPFTATALMMLVDEGKLSIDDPVEKYLPEFRGLRVKTEQGLVPADHPILIRELLSHTSGMANISEDYTLPLADRVRIFAKSPLDHQPGTTFKYVNAGIDTVGRIIEVVSGTPYGQFIQERLLTPLDMKDTTFRLTPAQRARLATPYQADAAGENLVPADSFLPPTSGKPYTAFPAGGLFSTASDLLKFCRMLLDGGTYEGKLYISESSIRMMTHAYTSARTGGSYGLGWMISSNSYFHDGAMRTRMTIEPQNNLIEIYLAQLGKPYVQHGDRSTNEFTATADRLFGNSQASRSSSQK